MLTIPSLLIFRSPRWGRFLQYRLLFFLIIPCMFIINYNCITALPILELVSGLDAVPLCTNAFQLNLRIGKLIIKAFYLINLVYLIYFYGRVKKFHFDYHVAPEYNRDTDHSIASEEKNVFHLCRSVDVCKLLFFFTK